MPGLQKQIPAGHTFLPGPSGCTWTRKLAGFLRGNRVDRDGVAFHGAGDGNVLASEPFYLRLFAFDLVDLAIAHQHRIRAALQAFLDALGRIRTGRAMVRSAMRFADKAIHSSSRLR